METVFKGEQAPPEKYSISVEEFKRAPEFLEDNSNLGKVTRENFTATFINTFARSRGIQDAQVIILNWMDVHGGFDYETTLRNLMASGGFSSLSQKERDLFTSAYQNIDIHERDKDSSDPILRADIEIEEILNTKSFINAIYPPNELAKLSKTEMLTLVNSEVEEAKSSKPHVSK